MVPIELPPRPRAMALMEALATLHAHYWGKVDHRERGSFWTMERRKPKKGGSVGLSFGCSYPVYLGVSAESS